MKHIHKILTTLLLEHLQIIFLLKQDLFRRTAGLTSFPDYLVLHMRRFVMEAGWVPKKLGMFCLDMVLYIKRVLVF